MQIFTHLITSLGYNITSKSCRKLNGLVHSTPNYYFKKWKFFLQGIRMSGKIINFEDKKINKSNFYKNKKLFKIEDIDINNILVSEEESYGTKNSLK